MAKSGGGFREYLDLYTKIVWAAVATVLLLGILCAGAHMHGCKSGCLKQGCPKVQKK